MLGEEGVAKTKARKPSSMTQTANVAAKNPVERKPWEGLPGGAEMQLGQRSWRWDEMKGILAMKVKGAGRARQGLERKELVRKQEGFQVSSQTHTEPSAGYRKQRGCGLILQHP